MLRMKMMMMMRITSSASH